MNEPGYERRYGGLTLGLPAAGRVVKYLLALNVGAFLLQLFLDQPSATGVRPLSAWLGVTVGAFWQIYRYVTFQFLHGGFWHILLNMLALYFLGSPLEMMWGSRRFLAFYLTCGVAAGVAYVIIGAATSLAPDLPIIGASGGVYGLILAAALYLPHMRLIFLFFPVPIRLAALIIFGVMLVNVLVSLSDAARGAPLAMYSAMSDVAHMGGAVAAGGWILMTRGAAGRGWFARMRRMRRLNKGAWERRMRARAAKEAELDRILQKIHHTGLQSLTRREKKVLQQATRRQQLEEHDLRWR